LGLSLEILLLSEIEKSGLIFSVFCTLIVPSNRDKKTMIRLKGIIALMAIVMMTSVVFGQNAMDAEGKKTGPWQITGAMSKETGYAPDALVEEGSYTRSRKEGLWKKYHPNGKLKSEVEFVKGRASGTFTTYFPNGNVEEKGDWKGGKYKGDYEMFYEDGTPRQKKTFNENGATEGKVQMW